MKQCPQEKVNQTKIRINKFIIYCSYCEDSENINSSQAAIERNAEVFKNRIESTDHPCVIPVHLRTTHILNKTVVRAIFLFTKIYEAVRETEDNELWHEFFSSPI